MNKKEQRNLKQSLSEGKEFDSFIMDSIYKNPIIRDLPDLAAMYGLYGRFVVSNDSVYFACGVNRDVIYGDFICARDTVIPEYLVKKCGYFLREDVHCGLLNLQCVVLSLDDRSSLFHGQVTGLRSVSSLFATIEAYCHRYREHGMEVPEFVFSDRHALDELQICISALTDRNKNEAERYSYWKREECLLRDHAIWHWPIRKIEDAGFSAFSACSRYALDTSNLSKAKRHYAHPEKWETMFQKGKFDSALFNENLDEEQMTFIMSGLDSMGIPYKTKVYDKKFIKYQEQENRDLKRRLRHPGELVRSRTISLHKQDVGTLGFLLTEYLKSQFSEKEHEIGRILYYGLNDANGIESSAYLFFMDSAFLGEFRKYADRNRILWGFPADIADGFEQKKGCFLIAEFSSMPLISAFLHRKMHNEFSTHAISSINQSAYEVRTYDQNGTSAWVMTPGVIKVGGNEHQAAFHDIPWCVPLCNLKDKGFLVENW